MKKKAPLHGGYELGKTYFISYWRQHCTVTAIHENVPVWGWQVECKWSDGHTTRHCTPLGKRDKEVVTV